MKSRSILILVCLGSITFAPAIGCKKMAPPPIMEKDSSNLTAQVMTVNTYLTRVRDTIVPPPDTTHTFGNRDTVFGIIQTVNANDGTELVGRWYYLTNGQKIAENSARLSHGTNLSHFDLINEASWLQGQYKLIVLIDGAPKDSTVFTIENRK